MILITHRVKILITIVIGLTVFAVIVSRGIRGRPRPIDSEHHNTSFAVNLLDLTGRPIDLPQATKDHVTVFLFTRTDCPISNRYAPEVQRLYENFSPQDTKFYLVYVDPDESVGSIRQHMTDYGYSCGALRDSQHELVKLIQAKVTPEAAVFVPSHSESLPRPGDPAKARDAFLSRMVYRGRIDDRYVDFGKSRPTPTTRDLEEVLEAIREGKPPPQRTTSAVGCYIADLR